MAEYRHLANAPPQMGRREHLHLYMKKFSNNLPPNTRRVPMTRDHLPITPQAGLDIDEFSIPARDGHSICVRSYRRTNRTDLPLLIYSHGGGFVTGGLETNHDSCRALAAHISLLV
jgi:acetyl esterase/lipase